ncbi:MAG: malate synthase G [bacterium]|nr:malate synthase G [bacterium]
MPRELTVEGLTIDPEFAAFISNEALPGLEIDEQEFWQGVAQIVNDLTPVNQALLVQREVFQAKIDAWHLSHKGQAIDANAYRSFLEEIGYLEPEGEDFTVTTKNIDLEISDIAGPQLVVPVSNARYALNAVNARWGSLYDALYGTDAIPQDEQGPSGNYVPERGEKVIAFARRFLDRSFPLASGSYADAVSLQIVDGALVVVLSGGQVTHLAEKKQLAGYRGGSKNLRAILLRNHGLHVEIRINRNSLIGKQDRAGIADLVIEAALSTILDCEDSVAVVDTQDKIEVYRNWLGLMKGDLSQTLEKKSQIITRTLNDDRVYRTCDGGRFTLRRRALMMVRNVGHLMTIDILRDEHGNPVFEGILDGIFTSLMALHDLDRPGGLRNSRAGSIYIVKPKMHGSREVAFAVELFSRIEQLLELDANTIKIGIMDEERRTTLNLKECIRAASERLFFINTGFLDRTGDEIHTSMEAGPMVRKGDMKTVPWIAAYEDWNVDVGLACGLPGHAQIGKGMWAMPDLMSDMLEQKLIHPKAGANTAWVPSPTAAVLHALHYHQVLVSERQELLAGLERATLEQLLEIPVAVDPSWSAQEIRLELDNNAQGILGYVSRWIDAGIGCSKVPDIHNVGLMEDRATLRISSQHMANWLHHGICTREQIMESMQRMASVVDEQNAGDPTYRALVTQKNGGDDLGGSLAFKAACDLVFEGSQQPSGYTEPILHAMRIKAKQRA